MAQNSNRSQVRQQTRSARQAQQNRRTIWPALLGLGAIVGLGVTIMLYTVIQSGWHWLAEVGYMALHTGFFYWLHKRWFGQPRRVVSPSAQQPDDTHPTIPLQRQPVPPPSTHQFPQPSTGGAFVATSNTGWGAMGEQPDFIAREPNAQQPPTPQQQPQQQQSPSPSSRGHAQHHSLPYSEIPWRYPPQHGRPQAPQPEQWWSGFAARVYGAVALIGLVCMGFLRLKYDVFWWIDVLPALPAAAIMIFYVKPVVQKRNDRRELLSARINDLDAVMWPADENQLIADKLLWRVIGSLETGTFYIRYVTRDSRWHLAKKLKVPIQIAIALVVIVILLIVNYFGEWAAGQFLDAYPWIFLGILGIFIGLTLVSWYLGVDWYYWHFMQTDEWLHMVRWCPIWFPWMDDISLTVPFDRVASVHPEVQSFWGKLLGYQKISIGEVKTNDASDYVDPDHPDERRKKDLDFDELRFIRAYLKLSRFIKYDIKRNADEALVQATRAAVALEENNRLQAHNIAWQEANHRILSQIAQQGQQPGPYGPPATQYQSRT